MARGMVVLGAAAVVACSSSSPTTPSPGTTTVPPVSLTGFITAQSGSQVLDATVTILDGPNALRFARTNFSGEYRFDGLVPGNANLSAVKNGYEERRGGLYIDGTSTLNFVLRTATPWNTRGGASGGFDMPIYVTRVRIQATWRGTGPSDFSVSVGGVNIVRTVLSELPNATYDATHAVSGGRVRIDANNVAISWSFIEVRD
jgi:hypothetical protein